MRYMATAVALALVTVVAAGPSPCAGQPSQKKRQFCWLTSSPINEKYNTLGGPQGFLGAATSPEVRTPDGKGCFRHFAGGSIYWSPDTGAHEVRGLIQEAWGNVAWEQGFLGYPKTDETKTPDGIGRFNHFQGGSIYWSVQTGAHIVRGAIRDKWANLGWEQSFLGYPKTDEMPAIPEGRYNHFQGGSIYWSAQTGAHIILGAIRDKWATLGWQHGLLGYPMTDEMKTPDGIGRYNHFQGGSIYWSTQTGAHTVFASIRDLWASLGWEKSCLGYPVSDQHWDGVLLQEFQGGRIEFDQSALYWCGTSQQPTSPQPTPTTPSPQATVGQLTIVLKFDTLGTRQFDVTVWSTGTIVTKAGTSGDTSFSITATHKVTPGGPASVSSTKGGLMKGTWSVTAVSSVTPKVTCEATVPGSVYLDVSGGQGLHCVKSPY